MWKKKTSPPTRELGPKEMNALVEASKVSEQEIQAWHIDFLDHYPSGRMDKQAFVKYYQMLQPHIGSETSFQEIFDAIDVNNDGNIDFNELLVTLVLMNNANDLGKRLGFAFEMWDDSGDGQIDQAELADVISAVYDCAGICDRKGQQDPKQRAKEIIAKLDIDGNKKLNKEEFINGCKNDPVIRNLLAPNA